MIMTRKITYADVQKAVDEAYELYKSDNNGSVDPRVAADSKPGIFGISLVLTDGRFVDKGDADVLFDLGPIVKIPLSAVLLSQNSPEGLTEESRCVRLLLQGKDARRFRRQGGYAIRTSRPQGCQQHRASRRP